MSAIGFELNDKSGQLLAAYVPKVYDACKALFGNAKYVVVRANYEDAEGKIASNPYCLNQLNIPYKMHIPCILHLQVDYSYYNNMSATNFNALNDTNDPTWLEWKNLFYMGSGALRGIHGVIISTGEKPPVTEYWLRAITQHLVDIVGKVTGLPVWVQIPKKSLTLYTDPAGQAVTWLSGLQEACVYGEAYSGSTKVRLGELAIPPSNIVPAAPWIPSLGFWNFARTKFIANLGLGDVDVPLWDYRPGEAPLYQWLKYTVIPSTPVDNTQDGTTDTGDETTGDTGNETTSDTGVGDGSTMLAAINSLTTAVLDLNDLIRKVFKV